MLRKTLFALIALSSALVAAQGCGDHPTDPPPTVQKTSALSSDGPPLNEPSICDPGLVAWNLGAPGKTYDTCAGGVEYQVFNASCAVNLGYNDPCSVNDGPYGCPDREQEGDPVANSCDWADSIGTVHRSQVISTTKSQHCDNGGDGKPVCEWDYTETTTCSAMVQGWVNSYHSNYQGEHNGGQGYNWGGAVSATNIATSGNDPSAYCLADLLSAPIGWHTKTANAANCGSTRPIYDTWPACAVQWNNHACGETSYYLDIGKSLSDVCGLPSSGSWAGAAQCGGYQGGYSCPTGVTYHGDVDPDSTKTLCITDENNPIRPETRASDVVAKYNRLVAYYQRDISGDLYDGGSDEAFLVGARIEQEIQLLFETFGDVLPEVSQQRAVQIFLGDYEPRDSPFTNLPSCGVQFTSPDASRCKLNEAAARQLSCCA